jgi:hypothetical protein
MRIASAKTEKEVAAKPADGDASVTVMASDVDQCWSEDPLKVACIR